MNASATPQAIDTREELASALTHGVGAAAALAGAAVLITLAALYGNGWQLGAAIVFGAALLLLYVASTLYHAIQHPVAKGRLKVFDHCAIYLLIAGTYTPFTLGALGGPWGWTLFGIVWSLAVVGVALKAFDRMSHPAWSTGLYLAMGWSVLIALGPLVERVATGGLVLLAAGGLAYTAGVVFFTLDSRLRYGHFVWHLFVVAGTSCHYFAVLHYAG